MSYRTHTTPYGQLSDPDEYKSLLIEKGYQDMGWKNGWDDMKYNQWKVLIEGKKVEDLQWNNTGSHCTYVCHERKVFCSVDMGD